MDESGRETAASDDVCEAKGPETQVPTDVLEIGVGSAAPNAQSQGRTFAVTSKCMSSAVGAGRTCRCRATTSAMA